MPFGLSREVPADKTAAWGARFIYPDDMLPDRQSFPGMETPAGQSLKAWLNSGALGKARKAARRMADTYKITPRTSETVTLFEDSFGKILASPNASHGYLYVVGFAKDESVEYKPTRFYIPKPDITDEMVPHELNATHVMRVYLNQDRKPIFWSGVMALPQIGDEIYVKSGKPEPFVVKGYFEEDGYLGVMALPVKRTKKAILQLKREIALERKEGRDPAAWVEEGLRCYFAVEISLTRPVARKKVA
jgi:hypothetical protein